MRTFEPNIHIVLSGCVILHLKYLGLFCGGGGGGGCGGGLFV